MLNLRNHHQGAGHTHSAPLGWKHLDVEQHFQALAQAPTEILRHIGSPFAPEKDQDAPLSLAQAA